ncbi:hypothetical protein XA68_11261 [Ophiocordyceps unilateralis]|uniref:Uncharacterized protein n=1 Tax=Ophiocordyceps unilateralis TaxID=268505 RepID=A0A2A9PG88_OPHUN|nr:hypothetical protein XA68_11261 [Ophiocordyceps unilateralis]
MAIDCHPAADFEETKTLLPDHNITFEIAHKAKVKIRTYNDHKSDSVRSSVTKATTYVEEDSSGWNLGVQISTGGVGALTVGRTPFISSMGAGITASYSSTKTSGQHRTESKTSEQLCGPSRYCTASDVTFSMTIRGFCRHSATVTCRNTVDVCAAPKHLPTRCDALDDWRERICGKPIQECTIVADIMEGDKPYTLDLFLENELPPLISGYSAGYYSLDFDKDYLYDPDRPRKRFWTPTKKWHSHSQPLFSDLDVSSYIHPVPKVVDYSRHAVKLDSDEWFYPEKKDNKKYGTERKGFYSKPTAPPPTQEDIDKWRKMMMRLRVKPKAGLGREPGTRERQQGADSKTTKVPKRPPPSWRSNSTEYHDSQTSPEAQITDDGPEGYERQGSSQGQGRVGLGNCSSINWNFDKVMGSVADVLWKLSVLREKMEARLVEANSTSDEAQQQARSDELKCFNKFAREFQIFKRPKQESESRS